MAGDSRRKKGGLKKKQSPPSSKAQPQIGQVIKEMETRKWSKTDNGLCRSTTADAWVADRFWTYMEERHAQGPDLTSLYPTNTGYGEVMGQR